MTGQAGRRPGTLHYVLPWPARQALSFEPKRTSTLLILKKEKKDWIVVQSGYSLRQLKLGPSDKTPNPCQQAIGRATLPRLPTSPTHRDDTVSTRSRLNRIE